MHVVSRRTGREFRHVKRAKIDSACRIQPRQQCRCPLGLDVPEYLAAAGGDLAFPIEKILVSERHAMQLAAGLSRRELRIASRGRVERHFLIETDEGVDFRLPGLDPVKTS